MFIARIEPTKVSSSSRMTTVTCMKERGRAKLNPYSRAYILARRSGIAAAVRVLCGFLAYHEGALSAKPFLAGPTIKACQLGSRLAA